MDVAVKNRRDLALARDSVPQSAKGILVLGHPIRDKGRGPPPQIQLDDRLPRQQLGLKLSRGLGLGG